jgi:hypothetical protein
MAAAWDQAMAVVEEWDVVMAGGSAVGEDAAGGNKDYFRAYCHIRTKSFRESKGCNEIRCIPFSS